MEGASHTVDLGPQVRIVQSLEIVIFSTQPAAKRQKGNRVVTSGGRWFGIVGFKDGMHALCVIAPL